MEAVSVNNLTFAYSGDGSFSLKNVSFDVEQGDILLIIGESGCGKTTLLRHLKPSHTPVGRRLSGDIRICGKDTGKLSESELSFKVGFVGQKVDEAAVTDKVWHELAFGLESMGCDQTYMQHRVAEMTAFFGLENVYHEKLSELSGGQKQLVNLAAVMIMEPEVLVLDEPTSQLDPNSSAEFFHMLRKIHEELGTTIIITEHRLEDIISMADKVIVLDAGEIIKQGIPGDVCRYLYDMRLPLFRSMPVAARIYCEVRTFDKEIPLSVNDGRRFLKAYIESHPGPSGITGGDNTDSRPCISMYAGRKDDHAAHNILYEKHRKRDIAISVDELWFRYKKDGSDILKACSIDIQKGRITAILGGNGAGKSTLLHLIMGNLPAYMGSVKLYEASVGLLPQNPQAMFAEKTVRDELHGDKMNVVNFFDLSQCLDMHPFDLSGGQMEKLALAKMVLADYDIFLLDEPGKGMDYAFKEKLGEYLISLANSGKTILLVSHDVEFCAKYADYCGMFFDGNITTLTDTRTFFLQNSFYTTAVRRMCRGMIDALTVSDVLSRLGVNESKAESRPADERHDEEKGKQKADERCYEEKEEQPADERRDSLLYSYIIPCVVFLVIMPVTIFIGYAVLHQRKYYFISLMLILEAVATMFIGFEGSRPKLKDIMTIAVLSAITALSRAMLNMVPAVKPMAALTIISGVGLGGISGFVVGALSMLVSDIFFGQGPWTPWQMFAMGLLGFLAGIVFGREGKRPIRTKEVNNLPICIFGAFSVLIIYGGIMNPASVLMYQENVTKEMLFASYIPGFPIDCIHAVSTFIFLWLLTGPMLEKLNRVKKK